MRKFRRILSQASSNTIPPSSTPRGRTSLIGARSTPSSSCRYRRFGHPFTLDLGGQTKFGPDVPVDEPTTRSTQLERIASTTLSAVTGRLSDGALQPGYGGIGPKLGGPNQAKYAADFMIQGPVKHGIAGLINLYGIESPGQPHQ